MSVRSSGMRIGTVIAFLSLLYASANAYVFSCEEVKYQLVNSPRTESTQYVCLIPEEGYSPDSLKNIYAQEDKVSTSFAEIAAAGCVERVNGGSWRIVADVPVDLDCSQEFSLIFTSSKNQIVRAEKQINLVTSSGVVIVAPRTGIRVQTSQCTGSGNVTVNTGAGTGVAEFRYPMQSWRCADIPEWIVAFDNVITIVVDAGTSVTVEYSKHDYTSAITVSTTDRVAVMSSGRSDNLQNLNPDQNVAIFSAGADVLTSADISSSFDQRYDGSLIVSGDDYTWFTKQFYNESLLHLELPSARTIKVVYGSKTIAAQDLWDSQDNFVVELKLNQAIAPTVAPTIAPTAAPTASEYCECKVDKFGTPDPDDWDTTTVWVDVVIILDCSEAMGAAALISATELIESFIGDKNFDVLITDVTAPFYTRMGLVAMSDTADIIYSLNMTKFDDVKSKVHIKEGVSSIDVVDAFEVAQQMFVDEMRPDRQTTRQIIYYMTDSDPSVITAGIKQFKTSKGTIIVNDFIQEGVIVRPGLKDLASPGYYYTDIQENYYLTIQLFCKANCYCLAGKEAYNPASNIDPAIIAAGGCIAANGAGYSWSRQQDTCASLGNGGLIVSLHDDDKAQFATNLLRRVASKASYFWQGYSKSDDGQWRFEDQSTDPTTNWDVGEPSPNAVSKCGYVDMTTLKWGAGNCQTGFPSVCEFPPCMAGNKC